MACCADAAPGMALIGQCGSGDLYTNDALLFTFEDGKLNLTPKRFQGENIKRCQILQNPGEDPVIFLNNHHSRRAVGSDTVSVYTGGTRSDLTQPAPQTIPAYVPQDEDYNNSDDMPF